MEHFPPTSITIIPEEEQRYDTLGDYGELDENGILNVKITKWNFLEELQTILHEIGEWALCEIEGVTIKAIDAWDMGEGKDLDDPGAHPDCPYHGPHMTMLKVEEIIYDYLGVKKENRNGSK